MQLIELRVQLQILSNNIQGKPFFRCRKSGLVVLQQAHPEAARDDDSSLPYIAIMGIFACLPAIMKVQSPNEPTLLGI